MVVPVGLEQGRNTSLDPAFSSISHPLSEFSFWVDILSFATDAIDAKASPLNPKYEILNKSSDGSFDVA